MPFYELGAARCRSVTPPGQLAGQPGEAAEALRSAGMAVGIQRVTLLPVCLGRGDLWVRQMGLPDWLYLLEGL